MLQEKEKLDWFNVNSFFVCLVGFVFVFCIVPVAEYFRARLRQYSIDKNMMAIGHLLKRDIYVIINADLFKGK